MSKKRIVLVEDEKDMAELVALRLKREGYTTEVAHDGLAGIKLIRSSPPDLVLLDIMLPGLSGTEILQEMRKDPRLAAIPVVMLTAKAEDSDVVVGLQFGADDYITKPFNMSVLMARIAAILRRASVLDAKTATVITAGPIRIDQECHQVEVNGQPVVLTLTEFKLLSALMVARGRVLSRNQLIDQAVSMDAIITDRAIDVHLTALRRKLGVARKLIQTVRGVGYRFALDDHENL